MVSCARPEGRLRPPRGIDQADDEEDIKKKPGAATKSGPGEIGITTSASIHRPRMGA